MSEPNRSHRLQSFRRLELFVEHRFPHSQPPVSEIYYRPPQCDPFADPQSPGCVVHPEVVVAVENLVAGLPEKAESGAPGRHLLALEQTPQTGACERKGHDALPDRVPELPVTAFAGPQLLELCARRDLRCHVAT